MQVIATHHPPTMNRPKPVTLTKDERSIVDAVAGLILRATPDGGLAWALRADASGALAFYVGDYPGMSPIEACIRAAALRGRLVEGCSSGSVSAA